MSHEFPKPHTLLLTSYGTRYTVAAEEVEPLLKSGEFTFVKQSWPSYAWPGGYPFFYTSQDGGCLCPKCVNENFPATLGDDPQWRVTAVDINWEDDSLHCDHCGSQIEAAYAEG